MKAKVKKEAKRRIVKEENIEYFQQLWDKVLVEDTILLEGAEKFQIMGSKYKEVFLEDDRNS